MNAILCLQRWQLSSDRIRGQHSKSVHSANTWKMTIINSKYYIQRIMIPFGSKCKVVDLCLTLICRLDTVGWDLSLALVTTPVLNFSPFLCKYIVQLMRATIWAVLSMKPIEQKWCHSLWFYQPLSPCHCFNPIPYVTILHTSTVQNCTLYLAGNMVKLYISCKFLMLEMLS